MKRLVLFLVVVLSTLVLPGILCLAAGVVGVRLPIRFPVAVVLGGIGALGVAGSLASLFACVGRACRRTNATVLVEATSAAEAWLLATVEREARSAGIRMPVVALYPAAEPNAFVVGTQRNRALVGVSAGLLKNLTQDDIEGVLGSLVSQAASGDMVTMGLLQGVLDTFVFVPAALVGIILDRGGARPNEGDGGGFIAVARALAVLLVALPAWIVAVWSRGRVLRGDAGGAHLAGRRKMVAVLEKLRPMDRPSTLGRGMACVGFIPGPSVLFPMHPSFSVRAGLLGLSAP